MKKIFKIIMIMLLISISLINTATAEELKLTIRFSDLNESHWAYSSVEKLVNAGIISGYPDGTFKPEGFITRAELVKIVNLIYSFTEKQETTSFTDITPNDWYYENILIAQNAGYIIGYPDNTFEPNNVITRQELCKIIDAINNLIELPYDNFPADEVSPWATGYVNKVISNRIMLLDENSNFRATEKATRAEACDALAKFLLTEEELSTNNSSGAIDQGPEQSIYETMDTVTRRLENDVMPALSTDAQKEIVSDIVFNMEKYQLDNNHDYESAAEAVYEKYKDMAEEEQEELKELIQLKNSTNDLLELKEFFFPDVDLK